MTCFHPMVARHTDELTKNGKYKVKFIQSVRTYAAAMQVRNEELGFDDLISINRMLELEDKFMIPCQQCLGCRESRSRMWAVRCMHESQMHTHNSFISLTFDDHLKQVKGYSNVTHSLRVKDFKNFMKRLRKRLAPLDADQDDGTNIYIRDFHCGEYGDQYGRPHHHAIIFGYNFPDRYYFKTDKVNGYIYYRSELLERMWSVRISKSQVDDFPLDRVWNVGNKYYFKMGYATVCDFSYDTAAYVARYIVKKRLGKGSNEHYMDLGVKPEYITMSRNPGIAYNWYKRYWKTVFPNDFTTYIKRGKVIKVRPPRYYSNMYEISHPDEYENIRQKRKDNAKIYDNEIHRLGDKESVKRAQLDRLVRRIH